MTLVRIPTQTPTISAGAYAVGDAVGGKLTFNDVVSGTTKHGRVVGCRVKDKAKQSAPLELWLFREDFTPTSNNAPFAPSDGDLANLAGVVGVSEWFDASDNSTGQAANLPLSFVLNTDPTDTKLFGQLVSRGEPIYASTTDLAVELEVEQDPVTTSRQRRAYEPPQFSSAENSAAYYGDGSTDPSRIPFEQAVNNMDPDEFVTLLYNKNRYTGTPANAAALITAVEGRLAIESPTSALDDLKPQGILTLMVKHPDGSMLASKSGNITSSASSGGMSPTVVFTLASAPNLIVGNTFTVYGHVDGGSSPLYNATHTITVISGTSVTTSTAYTADGTGGTWRAGGNSLENDGTGDGVRIMLDLLRGDYEADRSAFLTSATLANIAARDAFRTEGSPPVGRHVGFRWNAISGSSIRNEDNNYELESDTGVLVDMDLMGVTSHDFGSPYGKQMRPTHQASQLASLLSAKPSGYRGILCTLERLFVHRQTIDIQKNFGGTSSGTFTLSFNDGTTTKTTNAISITEPFVSTQAASGGTAATQLLNTIRYELSRLANIPRTGAAILSNLPPASAAAHTNGVSSTTITLTDSPNLSAVTAGTDFLWLAGHGFSKITAVDNSAKTVTIQDARNIASGSPVNYTIGEVAALAVFYRYVSATRAKFEVYFFDKNKRDGQYSAYGTAGYYSPETSDELGLGVDTTNLSNTNLPTPTKDHLEHTYGAELNWLGQLLGRNMKPHLIPTSVSGGNEYHKHNVVVPDVYNFKQWLTTKYLPGLFQEYDDAGIVIDYLIFDAERPPKSPSDALYNALYHGHGSSTEFGTNGMNEWTRYFTTQEVYEEFYQGLFSAAVQADLANGDPTKIDYGSDSFESWANTDRGVGAGYNQLADLIGAIWEKAKVYWGENLKCNNWLNAIKSHGFAGTAFATGPQARWLGSIAGSHANVVLYGGGSPIATDLDHHRNLIPPGSEDLTFSPNCKVVLKSLSRNSSGVVTATAFTESEIDSDPRRGNDQRFRGFAVGDLVSLSNVLNNATVTAEFLPFHNADDTVIDPGPWSVLSVTDETITFQQGRTSAVSTVMFSPQSLGKNVAVLRFDNWQKFLSGVITLRAMFAGAKFPISFWNATWWTTGAYLLNDNTHWQGDPTWYAQPNKDLLFALKYHERLHNVGEDFIPSYMPPGAYDWIGYNVVSGGIDNGKRVDTDKALEHENGFADSLRVLDELIPYKTISPVSLNYTPLSFQKSHHVPSAAMLPDGRLLTHVAWRPGGGLIRVKSRTTIIKDGRGRYHELPGTPVKTAAIDPCTTGIWLVAR